MLSHRQHQIARMLSECYTHKEIAPILGIEASTVNAHIDVMREKLRNSGHEFKTLRQFLILLQKEYHFMDYLPFDVTTALDNPTRVFCTDTNMEVVSVQNKNQGNGFGYRYPLTVGLRNLWTGHIVFYTYDTFGNGQVKTAPRLLLLNNHGVEVEEALANSDFSFVPMAGTDTARHHTASPDANVESVRRKLLDRSVVGLKKYGVTTQRSDIDFAGWLLHLQEELLDAAVYIEATLTNSKEQQ